MLYLDYAKPIGERYILNFFADKVEDIQEVSNGKSFVTKNGIDYGVPMASSTVVITTPDKVKKTYILGEDGEWKEGSGSSVQADYAQNDPTQPDYIKNRLVYGESTGSFDFKIISGELAPNSTMVVEINGVQYTDTVQTLDLDANMEEDDGEAHELAYYIGNGEYFGAEKRDFPFAYSDSSILSLENEGNVIIMDNLDAQRGETISLDGVSCYLKSYSEDPLLYAGNFYLISPEAEDTGENFVVLVNYSNMYNIDIDEQAAPTLTYSTLIIFKNNNISFTISKPTKKLYESYIEMPTVEKNIADLKKNVKNLTDGANTFTGSNTFTGTNTFEKSVTIQGADQQLVLQSGKYLGYEDSQIAINNNGKIIFRPIKNYSNYTIELPKKTGTIALTSDIPVIDLAKKIEVTDNGEVNKALDPNIFYDFTGELTKLTIRFAGDDSSKAYEYKGQFKSGATVPTVTFPSGVRMIGSSIEANKTYQFSIVNNIGVVIGV